MTILCDTSVLIPALVQDLPQHDPSFRILRMVHEKKIMGAVCVHSLAECYAGLTSIPGESQITPLQAKEIIKNELIRLFRTVELKQDDYDRALERVAAKNIKSGVIYDALIFQSAVKAKVSHLVTWNVKDFKRLSDGEIQIVTPEDL